MQSFDFRKLLPHLLIIGIFAVIALLFCYPALQGKVLNQHDTVSWQAMSHEAKEWHEKTGENTLWSNSMFGGMPTYTYYIPKSNNFLAPVYGVVTGLLPKPANFLLLAMVCFYVLMSVMRVDRWLGLIGSVAFAFATYNPQIIAAGHETKMYAMCFMPATLTGLLLLFRGRYLTGGALFSVSAALMICTGHYQIVYYDYIILGIVGLGLLIHNLRTGKAREGIIATVLAGVLTILAVGPSMAGILPTQEYVKETMRGGQSELTINNHDKNKKSGGLDKDYAFRWSYGIGETFTILVPYVYGGGSAEPADRMPQTNELLNGQYDKLPSYWGTQPGIAGPVYFGAVICFLFVLGLLVVRSSYKWWILAASVLGIVMAWGNNYPDFNYWLFDHIPGLNKFRTPSMNLVIPQFLFPLLGIWAVNEIITGKVSGKELWRKVLIALGITAGLAFLVGVCGSLFFDFSNPAADNSYPAQMLTALKEDRAAMARNSGIRSIVFILLAAGLLWLFVKEHIKGLAFVAGLGALVAIDQLPIAFHYLNEEKYVDAEENKNIFTPTMADAEIMKDPDPYYRVLDVTRDTYNDAIQAYFHKCVGGYSPAKLEIYQDLIETHMSGRFNGQVLNMLNTKYIIVPGGPNQQPAPMPNPGACGNAWFVDEVKLAATADEEILSLNAPALGDTVQAGPNSFDPRKTAVIRKSFEKELSGYSFGKDSASFVKLAKYGLNDISFKSSNSRNGLAVFSDIWYPHGWEAYIDGKQVPILRANYVLRALKIPAGEHSIEFKFRPASFEKGNQIALFSSVLLLLFAAAGLVMAFRNRSEAGEGPKTPAKTA